MSLISFGKSIFLKLISKKKVRFIPNLIEPKFLILMNQNIGDFIVCSPILKNIKLASPKSQIHVLANEVNKDLALENPNIDNVVIYKNKWQKLFPMLLGLRKENFDIAIELEAKVVTKVIILLKIINAKCILAVSKTEGRYGMNPNDVLPYDFYTNYKLKHQRDTCLDILRLMNIKCLDKSYDVYYKNHHKQKVVSYLASFDSTSVFIALNIAGSSKNNKISPADVHKIILGLYASKKNIVIILLHKPSDREDISNLIPDEASSFAFLSYPTQSILEAAALIDAMDLVISPDTSIVHIACALNKPLVSIYTANKNNFDKWYPISSSNKVIFSEHISSLESLDISKIIDSSLNLLSNNSRYLGH
jgi:ADP-heptose:LPS heptosyltransferase